MARFSYKCLCGRTYSISLEDRLSEIDCECGKKAKHVFRIKGGISIMEKLDNGLMGRAVERLHNIEEVLSERSDKHTQEYLNKVELQENDDGK